MRKVYDLTTGTMEELPSLPPTPQVLTKLQKQHKINEESLYYLKNTDWYVIRMSETNVTVPDKILKARAAARYAIKEV
tara:strand:- start:1557 stop:1790 length:234 start_codon:yes stop_codon:yes gene_type:complete